MKTGQKTSPPLRTSKGTWARNNVEEAQSFNDHLEDVFSHIPQKMSAKMKKPLSNFLEAPYQLEPPINRHKGAEVQEVINSLNPIKSSGYDLITGKILIAQRRPSQNNVKSQRLS
jgi:hypothetical protein